MRKSLFLICLIFASCGIPQVEDEKCTESREAVRTFYAEHLSESPVEKLKPEILTKIDGWLTSDLFGLLEKAAKRTDSSAIMGDPFTFSAEFPTGFKVGECQVSGERNVTHTVRLFWNVNSKPGEHLIKAQVEKTGDRWLIKDFVDPDRGSLVQMLSK